MKSIVLRREPEVTAHFIDDEAAKLRELLTSTPRISRRFDLSIDVGRSVFYMCAVDAYVDFVRNNPTALGIIAQKKAEAQEAMESGEDKGRVSSFPIARLPLEPDEFIISMDEQRFGESMGVAIVEDVNLAKVLLRSAVYYFESRAA